MERSDQGQGRAEPVPHFDLLPVLARVVPTEGRWAKLPA